jgi:flavocytochrome c
MMTVVLTSDCRRSLPFAHNRVIMMAQRKIMSSLGTYVLCVALLLVGVLAVEFHRFGDLPSGPVEDANCNVENVESANDDQLNSILMELTNRTYFRLYKVDLSTKCPFWQKDGVAPSQCGGTELELHDDRPIDNFLKEKAPKPTLCSLKTGTGASLPWGPQSAPVKKISTSALAASKVSTGCKDSSLPEFWLDLCPSPTPSGTDALEYVDLGANLEQFTGYNGSKLWDAIYQENCFSRQRAFGREPIMGELCYEERVLYRLLSGMHSAVNIHIALNYFPPRKGKRTEWAPNPQRFLALFNDHPERLKNLHFAFVVLLRALRKAAPALEKFPMNVGNKEEDRLTKKLLQRLLDAHIMKSCGPLFSAFDESQLFKQGNGPSALNELKTQFKGVFRNITSILDCVTCQKCKLHGKMQIMGLGTALTILLLPENFIEQSLSREEVVAFINTIAKFSDAISHVRDLSHLALAVGKEEETKKLRDLANGKTTSFSMPPSPVPTDNVAFDIVLDIVSKSAMSGRLSRGDEDLLVDGALSKDPRLAMLVKHYAMDPGRFVHHALRTLNANTHNGATSRPDAIIIGTGLSGLTAALTLIDRGAHVIIIDKQGYMGGNSGYASSGINAAKDEAFEEGKDSSEMFANDMRKSSGIAEGRDHPSKRLIPVLTSKSFKALEYAKSRVGVQLNEVGQLGGHSFARTYRPSTGMAGSELIFAISKLVKSYVGTQAEIKLKTKAVKLLVDSEGKAIGVKCKSLKTGTEEDLFADNVIVATGGFASDRTEQSLLKSFRPELASLPSTNGEFSTGDGHRIIMAAGGGTVDMEHVQVHPTAFVDPKDPTAIKKTLCAEILRGVGGIVLNRHGKRFVDELGTRKHIVDQMQAEAGSDELQFTIVLSPAMAAITDKHVPHYTKKGLLKGFESLEELASWMGVDASVVKTTVREYNEFAERGEDPFGKRYFKNTPFPDARNASEISEGKLYFAGTISPALHYTMGGVSIDAEGRVLRENGATFPGLYAVGEVAGGVHGVNRLGGNALTECIVFGQVVGEGIELNKNTRAPGKNFAHAPAITTGTASSTGSKKISLDELRKHNSANDCWVSIGGNVYDLTDFLEEHPGGPESVLEVAGKDATEVFDAIHTRAMLEDFDPIGVCDDCKKH